MLASIFLSLVIIQQIYLTPANFDGFLSLGAQQSEENGKVPARIYTDYLDVQTTAQSIIALDIGSGKILYQKNPDDVRSIASLTKLMTALVFLDHNPGWEKEFFTISSDRRNGNVIHLNTGEILSIQNLFYTALIASDNDAIIALARSTGLGEENFVAKMNEKARELGLQNSKFVEPSGLQSENKSTAKDIALLLNQALQNKDILQVTSTDAYEFEVFDKVKNKARTVKLQNTDHLLNSYLNVIGGKTGFLEDAGYCLAVKIKGEKDQEIIVVVLGSASNYDRFQDVKAISDWVFANYQWL